MKKAILFLSMFILFLSAIAQEKKEPVETKKEVGKFETEKPSTPTDTVVIDLTKTRFVTFKGNEQVVQDLSINIALFVPLEWIVKTYVFMNDAQSGLSVSQIQQNYQAPLVPFWNLYQKKVQEQQESEKQRLEKKPNNKVPPKEKVQ